MTTADDFFTHYSRSGKAGWYARLGPLRQAIIRCDGPEVLEILKSRCEVDSDAQNGCWIWKGATRSGYGYVGRDKTNKLARRVAWEAARSFTEELGWLSVHHKCGIRACINPDHLAAVSHLDNTIEMLERHAYLRRIADLERTLGAFDPDHVLLV
ncbi:HNH endonuclease [Arthrobacter sp. BHU FT2]|nr:HNH endonuclease [Arthrobacter sp. BHU FT2]